MRLLSQLRRIRHPRHHDLRRIGVGEAVLLREAIEGIGIVRRPDFVGIAQNAEVDAPAATRARFDFQLRMPLCQFGENAVEIAGELDVDALLLRRGQLVPARLAPVAVVVPLEEGDVVFGHQLVEKAE